MERRTEICSTDIWIASKLAEITERCGVSPIDLSIHFETVSPESGPSYYNIGTVDVTGIDNNPDVDKIYSLLGLDELGTRRFDSMTEVQETLARALSLAPRARAR